MRWLHIIDYTAGLSRLQQHNEHGQQNRELCANCTCPKSWLCPSHDTHMPERSLKTTLYVSPCLNWEKSLWLTSVLSACSSYLQNDKIFMPSSVFEIVMLMYWNSSCMLIVLGHWDFCVWKSTTLHPCSGRWAQNSTLWHIFLLEGI